MEPGRVGESAVLHSGEGGMCVEAGGAEALRSDSPCVAALFPDGDPGDCAVLCVSQCHANCGASVLLVQRFRVGGSPPHAVEQCGFYCLHLASDQEALEAIAAEVAGPELGPRLAPSPQPPRALQAIALILDSRTACVLDGKDLAFVQFPPGDHPTVTSLPRVLPATGIEARGGGIVVTGPYFRAARGKYVMYYDPEEYLESDSYAEYFECLDGGRWESVRFESM